MPAIACLTSVIFLIISISKERKNKALSFMSLFYALWTFILFLSMLNLYNIVKPSDEAYILIIFMLIFFGAGYLLSNYIFKSKTFEKKDKKEYTLKLIPFYILCGLIILFNVIDIIMIIIQLTKGTPMWQIRNWSLEPVGSSNPILDRRSFVENIFRNIILSPFAILIPPIAAYYFFCSKDKKSKYTLLIISIIVLITSSIAGGGGRLGLIYYLMSFILIGIIMHRNKEKQNVLKPQNKKIIMIIFVSAILLMILATIIRTGFGNIIKQIYTYFALPPTLLSVWLPDIKNMAHTYGLTSFFGVHSYIFRILETIGAKVLVPQIYYETFQNILNAEVFQEVGYGIGNAFVTPIYYFYIDGGYPFVMLASFFFGFLVAYLFKKFEADINVKSFVIYTLIMYGVLLTFSRIQTSIPSYIIAFIIACLIFKSRKKVEVKEEKTISKKREKNDLISVIVPVYNVEEYLKKCVDSIINQTYINLEIILVDDGSTDDSGKICDEYSKKDNRINVIHKENGGLSDARNAGIDIAKGKFLTFIDSDDFVENNYVELLYNTLVQYNADLSIASHKVIYDKTIMDKSTNEEFCSDSKLILEKILYDDGVDLSAWGKLYKAKLFKKVRFPVGRLYEDAATTYKLIDLSNKIAVCSKLVYNYVIREKSITNNTFSEKKMDLITSTKEMVDYIREKYPELEKACNRRLMYSYLSTLSQLAKTNDENKEIEQKLLDYIKENKKEVLKDNRITKRDRLGIYATIFGMKSYKFFWKCYSKVTKRT